MEETWETDSRVGFQKVGEYKCRLSRYRDEGPVRDRLGVINLQATFLSKCGLKPPASESPRVLVNTLLRHAESNALGTGPHAVHCENSPLLRF